MFIGLFFTAIFLIICITVASCFYEIRITSSNTLARWGVNFRTDSKQEVIFILNKVLLLISYSFFSSQWLLILINFGISSPLFYELVFKEPYYKKTISQFYKIMASYYQWTTTLLLFSKVRRVSRSWRTPRSTGR